MAHIPGSINMPHDTEHLFERRFAKDKEIIVYCASPDCPRGSRRGESPVTSP
ncbi:MAG: rhodanese-like domain-containing protein [Gammaproteobacteria bacterium]